MICVPVDLEQQKAAAEQRIQGMGVRLVDAFSAPLSEWLSRECVPGLDSEEIAEALARVLDGVIDSAARHIGYCAAREDLVPMVRCDIANRMSLRVASSLMTEQRKETAGHA